MRIRGLSEAGLTRLHEAMAGQLNAGRAPGMVLGLSRGDDAHIDAIGAMALEGGQPIRPDTLFRITSMTRPITAVATLLLIEEGRLALDEPVDRLLPELSDRQVLRNLDGPIDDTVAAERPITVRDLLTFRGGFGMILAKPSEYPILEAEETLDLRSVGPPTPVTPHRADEWLRRMGTLPLMDQPGDQWRYSTGSLILGVLIARAAERAVESFYRERIFDPLGMHDAGFRVPASEHHRLAPCYREME
ncbi:MAG: serine hydrolase domain-containing protein, partial [Acidimicrobiales bacterium]